MWNFCLRIPQTQSGPANCTELPISPPVLHVFCLQPLLNPAENNPAASNITSAVLKPCENALIKPECERLSARIRECRARCLPGCLVGWQPFPTDSGERDGRFHVCLAKAGSCFSRPSEQGLLCALGLVMKSACGAACAVHLSGVESFLNLEF